MERVVEYGDRRRGREVGHSLVDVAAERLDLAMDGLREAVHAKVHDEIGARPPAGHFLAHQEVTGVSVPVEELETTIDAVVIGDRDEVHATHACHAIHVGRRRIAIAAPQEREIAVQP